MKRRRIFSGGGTGGEEEEEGGGGGGRDDAMSECGSIRRRMKLLLITCVCLMTVPMADGYVFYIPMGCYNDVASSPDLSGGVAVTLIPTTEDGEVNRASCASYCNSQGFPYSGLALGIWCHCGDQYGRYDRSFSCNFSCPLVDGDECGGVSSNSIYYAVDTDPAKRVKRSDHYWHTGKTFLEARHDCILQDGDLVVVDAVKLSKVAELVNQSQYASSEVWIGLSRMFNATDYTWANPAIKPMDVSVDSPAWEDAESFTGSCVVLDVNTLKIRSMSCSAQKPYVCTQIPPPDPTVGPDGAAGGGDAEEEGNASALDEQTELVMWIVLPIFLFCYGGSCLVYVIGKTYRMFKRRRRAARLAEAYSEFEPDTKPMTGRPLTSRDIRVEDGRSPPPPYYRATSRQLKSVEQPLVEGYRSSPLPSKPGGRAKVYEYEETEPPQPLIDYSKLSIQDIIYIKSLMGERRPLAKKKKILVA